MTTYRWDMSLGVARYVRAGHIFPYGRVFYLRDYSTACTAVAHIQFGHAVSLGAFDTEAEARAAIEAVIPLYLSETDL